MSDALDVVPIQAQYLDRDRVIRGSELEVEFSHMSHDGWSVFQVMGGDEPHWVGLSTGYRSANCDCGDFTYRQRICKHISAVLLRIGHLVMKEYLQGEFDE